MGNILKLYIVITLSFQNEILNKWSKALQNTIQSTMRIHFVTAAILCFNLTVAFPQARFVGQENKDFYEWFHSRSQVANLYTNGAELFTFAAVKVNVSPCKESSVTTCLPIGYRLINIVSETEDFTKDEINGYQDLWFHVKGTDPEGNYFNGYVWGAFIAKSWEFSDMTGDGKSELVMLGITSQTRKNMKDINAEIKVVKNGKLWTKTSVPGLCVFEECASSALIRILKDQPCQGALMVEVSTMTIGCEAGIEKAYYFQTPSGELERVFHAEYTTRKQFRNKSFEYTSPNGDIMLCRYDHEDENFNPVWEVKKIKSGENTIAKTTHEKARA